MSTAIAANSPAWRDPKIAKLDPQRTRCADVLEGVDRLLERRDVYLPKLPRETTKNYEIRCGLTKLTNLLGGAVRASEGLLVANPPTLNENASPELRGIWQDVDGMQTGGVVWLREVIRRMTTEGGVVAVSASPVRADARPTVAQETALRLRPYVVLYRYADVMSVRLTRLGGKLVIQQLVLRERVEEADGQYGMKTVKQYLVLRRSDVGPHTGTIYRETEDGSYAQVGTPSLIETAELPVVDFSADPSAGFARALPPLLDIADATLEHFLTKSDRRWAMRQTCFPWLVRIGYRDDDTAVGPSEALDLPTGGDAKFISPSIDAMQPTRDELADIERRAAALSLSFLAGETPGADQTATAAAIDQEGQDAGLAALLVSLRDSLNRLFAQIDELLGNTPRDEYFSLSTKLRGRRRDPVYLRVLVDAWRENGLPLEALLYALKSGELPDDLDIEKTALELVAEVEAQRQADAARIRDQQPPPDASGDDSNDEDADEAAAA